MLSINDISVRIAGRLLIDDSSVQIVPGARVGFVGRNGVGKSTLFHAIRGDLPTESGTIAIPPRWQIGSLAQEAPNGPEKLIEVVLKADRERETLIREAEVASDPTRIAEIQTRRWLMLRCWLVRTPLRCLWRISGRKVCSAMGGSCFP